MRQTGARRIAWRALVLSLFAIAILARNATGAPNVQVSFPGYVHKVEVAGSSTPTTDIHLAKAEAFTDSDSAHKQYKKYLCPDRILDSTEVRVFNPYVNPPAAHFESLNFSTIPLTIHSHAPPLTDRNTSSISQSILQGASSIEFESINQCSGGISLNGLRAI